MSTGMDTVLRQVDLELAKTPGPYFLGDDISLVDIMYTPFLERMAASLPYFKGFVVRGDAYPHLKRWYEAMDTRETYQGIKSDYVGVASIHISSFEIRYLFVIRVLLHQFTLPL